MLKIPVISYAHLVSDNFLLTVECLQMNVESCAATEDLILEIVDTDINMVISDSVATNLGITSV